MGTQEGIRGEMLLAGLLVHVYLAFSYIPRTAYLGNDTAHCGLDLPPLINMTVPQAIAV